MSFDQFITQMLSIKEDDLEEITPINQSYDTSILKLKLKDKSSVCPCYSVKVKIHGYYTRILTHAPLVSRKCHIFYQQRRYICPGCELTFHESNPFINTKECLTYKTKL